jgi:MSHA biogenesis protein MshP
MRPSRGFGVIAAILVLVVLATIAAAVVRLSTSQQSGFAQQVTAARAAQAAQAGAEWGLFQALRNGSCASTTTLDLSTDLGMHVTVSCSTGTYNEGELPAGGAAPVKVYTIDAVACNSAACPDASRAVTPFYVERRRQVHAAQ